MTSIIDPLQLPEGWTIEVDEQGNEKHCVAKKTVDNFKPFPSVGIVCKSNGHRARQWNLLF